MNKKKEILLSIKSIVKKIDLNAEVILFGSHARNDARDESDWDILILTSMSADIKLEQVFRHKLFDLELKYGVALSTFVYSKEEWNSKYQVTPLYQNIRKEGIAL